MTRQLWRDRHDEGSNCLIAAITQETRLHDGLIPATTFAMRAVVQRVGEASVSVDGEVCGAIREGLLVYLGVGLDDDAAAVALLSEKIARLRIFPDEQGRMNRDVVEAGGAVLVISNFTLMGDARKGRRPSYTDAAEPELANRLYEQFCAALRTFGLEVQTGRFRAMMEVHSINAGPVTILLDSQRVF